MLPTTYIAKVDHGYPFRACEYLLETRVGATFSGIVNDVIYGQFDMSPLMRVYKIEGERIEDVSSEVCAEILKYAETGKMLGRSAEAFLDYHGFDIPGREEAA